MEKAELTKLLGCHDLRAIAALAACFGVEAYLVGGALRDLILGEEANDLDFALSGAWEELPAAFALHIGGSFFWLDAERQQSRVAKKGENGSTVYDFAPLRGASIEEDLTRRDFTVNALAVPLFGDRQEIADPLRGGDDLQSGTIRACGAASFDDDPLRLLRAVRFGAELGFAIEEDTWENIRRKAGLLKTVAVERVRDELFKILAAPGCGASLRRLGAAGLWPAIAPVPEVSLSEAAIGRAEAAELLCAETVPLAGYLGREVEGGIAVLALVKLAALLVGAEVTATALAQRLRLGKEAGRLLAALCREEREPCRILERNSASRVMYRFFRDREPAGPGVLIIAKAAGALSTPCFARLLGYYLREYDPCAADLFLSGGEIMEILGVRPGEAVGAAMARLREAEAAGEVASREEAREFIKNLLTKEEPIG